jgi:hypothetical protein
MPYPERSNAGQRHGERDEPTNCCVLLSWVAPHAPVLPPVVMSREIGRSPAERSEVTNLTQRSEATRRVTTAGEGRSACSERPSSFISEVR